MSLESLEICGIRGFSPDHSCKIDISSPLTIITGPTGGGKTAILEALQVAVTGFNVQTASKRIPPEINDPNTHARSETVASVRLVFQGADNIKYTAERQYKLEGASPTGNTSGYFSSHPPKLTSSATSIHPDISMLPKLLQVSNPVWDSLIFVYQEDALWPLGKPDEVKDHMDKITRLDGHSEVLHMIQYGMQQIKIVESTTASELAKLEKDFEEFIEVESRFKREEKSLSEISQECVSLESNIDALNAKVNIQKQRDEMMAIVRVLQERKRGWNNEKERMERNLSSPLPGQSKEHLEQQIREQESFLRDKGLTTLNMVDEFRAVPQQIADITIEVNRLEMERERLRSQATGHQEQRNHIYRLKLKLSRAQEFASSSVDHVLPPVNAEDEEWTTTLDSLYQTSREESASLSKHFTNIRKKAEEEEKDKWYECKREKDALDRIEAEIEDLETKLGMLQGGVLPNSIQQEHDALQTANERVLEAETKWRQSDKVASGLRQEVKALKETIKVVDCNVQRLEAEEENAKKQDDRNRKVKTLKEQYQNAMNGCSKSLEELSNRLTTSVSALGDRKGPELSKWLQSPRAHFDFDDIFSAEEAERESASLLRIEKKLSQERKFILGEAERQRAKHQKKFGETSLQEKNATRRSENWLKESRTTAKKAEGKILQSEFIRTHLSGEWAQFERIFPSLSTPSSRYRFSATHEQVTFIQTMLAEMKAKIQQATEEVWRLKTGLRHVTQEFELFRKNFQCPACGVQGSDKAGIEKMTEFFEQRMSEYENPENLVRAEHDLRQLKQAKMHLSEVEWILTKAISDSSTYEKAEEYRRTAESQRRVCEREKKKCEKNIDRIKALDASRLEDYVLVNECLKSVQRFRDVSDQLKRYFTAQSSEPEGRPSCDVSTELKDQRATLQRTSSELNTKTEELYSCTEDENEFVRAGREFAEQENICDTLERLKILGRKADDCKRNIEKRQNKFLKARDILKKTLVYHDEKLARVSEFENMRRGELEEWRRSLDNLGFFDRDTNSREQDRVEKSLEGRRKDLGCQQEKLNSLKRLETLRGNLDVCVAKKKIADIDREIREKEQHYEDEDDVVGADLQEMLRNLQYERERKSTRKKVREERVEELRRQMEKSQVFLKKLNQCHIKKAVVGYSSKDLKSIYRARDKALTAGHRIKMGSINRAIMKLWHSSYRGTKIDEIRIGAYEKDAGKGGKTPKRYFQYYVEMRQGQSWVKMRGRCSTGQKYFACLIVRLALVEMFCEELSFLVLDQPTANVDREHAGYIGRAINIFLASRRKRGNFHLLLATTDRDLADMLDAQEYCDHCYVTTEDENSYSMAERRNLQEL